MTRIYVCENCGRLGRLGVPNDFEDECRPGWTHGRLIEVASVTANAVELVAALAGAAERSGSAADGGPS